MVCILRKIFMDKHKHAFISVQKVIWAIHKLRTCFKIHNCFEKEFAILERRQDLIAAALSQISWLLFQKSVKEKRFYWGKFWGWGLTQEFPPLFRCLNFNWELENLKYCYHHKEVMINYYFFNLYFHFEKINLNCFLHPRTFIINKM